MALNTLKLEATEQDELVYISVNSDGDLIIDIVSDDCTRRAWVALKPTSAEATDFKALIDEAAIP